MQKTNIFGVENFLPEEPLGEDERTIALYKDRLVGEYRKLPHSRKASVIEMAMEKTFATRRKEILLQGKFVQELLDDYPALKDPLQVTSISSRTKFKIL